MSSAESVTERLEKFKLGDSFAAHKICRRYWEKLVRLARKRVEHVRGKADENDVANHAFCSFLQGVEAGRFPRLEDRDDLWQVLFMLTERKAIDQAGEETAARRGGGNVRGESALEPVGGDSGPPGVQRVPDLEPTPEFAAILVEERELRLAVLDDGRLRRIAKDKLAGYTNQEIAEREGVGLRSIERALRLIRRTWKRESDP